MSARSGAVAMAKLRTTACIVLLSLAFTAFSAADDALFYMPNAKAYLAINLNLARSSPGLQRMREVLEKNADVKPVISYPAATEKIYIVNDESFLAPGGWAKSFFSYGQTGICGSHGLAV